MCNGSSRHTIIRSAHSKQCIQYETSHSANLPQVLNHSNTNALHKDMIAPSGQKRELQTHKR